MVESSFSLSTSNCHYCYCLAMSTQRNIKQGVDSTHFLFNSIVSAKWVFSANAASCTHFDNSTLLDLTLLPCTSHSSQLPRRSIGHTSVVPEFLMVSKIPRLTWHKRKIWQRRQLGNVLRSIVSAEWMFAESATKDVNCFQPDFLRLTLRIPTNSNGNSTSELTHTQDWAKPNSYITNVTTEFQKAVTIAWFLSSTNFLNLHQVIC